MDKYKCIKRASILGIIGNLFLFIIKIIVGVFTNSISMIGDSFNSLGDIFSSFITYIGNKIASIPRDDDHNLGHGKAEYIYAMMISFIMFLLGFILLKDSIISLFNNKNYNFSIWLIIVCIISIIIKLFLYFYSNNLSKKYNNLLIKANSKDHRNDIIITIFTLISCILTYYKLYIFDSVIGILIAIWIIIDAIIIYKESYDVLMDKAISHELKKKIFDIIKKYDDIEKVIHFNSTPVGYKYQISFTIYVDGNMTTEKSHSIANKLEKEIVNNIDEIYLAIIHVNPIIKK